MSVFGNNLTKAKAAAQANADYFGIPFFVVSTTNGLYVERERPINDDLILYTAAAPEGLELAMAFESYLLDDSRSERRRAECLKQVRAFIAKATGETK